MQERLSGTDRGDGTLMPLIDITVSVEGRATIATALVDSGADFSAVPWPLLRTLGADESLLTPVEGDRLGGLTGAGMDWYPAELSWRGRVFASRVTVPSHAADLLSDELVIVGSGDFFRQFAVTFQWCGDEPSFEVRLVE